MRESDTIARFGGDEFVALIEDFAAPGDIVSVAQKILHAVRWPFLLEGVAITQAIIAMAHSLRLKVVAEGVETREQLDFLTEHGCHEFQGHYFRKPQPAEDFTKLLRENAAGAMAIS